MQRRIIKNKTIKFTFGLVDDRVKYIGPHSLYHTNTLPEARFLRPIFQYIGMSPNEENKFLTLVFDVQYYILTDNRGRYLPGYNTKTNDITDGVIRTTKIDYFISGIQSENLDNLNNLDQEIRDFADKELLRSPLIKQIIHLFTKVQELKFFIEFMLGTNHDFETTQEVDSYTAIAKSISLNKLFKGYDTHIRRHFPLVGDLEYIYLYLEDTIGVPLYNRLEDEIKDIIYNEEQNAGTFDYEEWDPN